MQRAELFPIFFRLATALVAGSLARLFADALCFANRLVGKGLLLLDASLLLLDAAALFFDAGSFRLDAVLGLLDLAFAFAVALLDAGITVAAVFTILILPGGGAAVWALIPGMNETRQRFSAGLEISQLPGARTAVMALFALFIVLALFVLPALFILRALFILPRRRPALFGLAFGRGKPQRFLVVREITRAPGPAVAAGFTIVVLPAGRAAIFGLIPGIGGQ